MRSNDKQQDSQSQEFANGENDGDVDADEAVVECAAKKSAKKTRTSKELLSMVKFPTPVESHLCLAWLQRSWQ